MKYLMAFICLTFVLNVTKGIMALRSQLPENKVAVNAVISSDQNVYSVTSKNLERKNKNMGEPLKD